MATRTVRIELVDSPAVRAILARSLDVIAAAEDCGPAVPASLQTAVLELREAFAPTKPEPPRVRKPATRKPPGTT